MLTSQVPQDFLKAVATERGVSDGELNALSLALDGKSTTEIATQLGITGIAVRKRLGEVYRKFQIAGSGPGKLAELRHQLLSQYQGHPVLNNFYSSNTVAKSEVMIDPSFADTIRHQDWGEAPDVSVFYGRTEELTMLKQWIVQERCRLIALLGMGGIGKTALSVKLAKQLEDEFEYVIWRSLHLTSPIQEVLSQLIQFVSQQQAIKLLPDIDKQISILIEYLRQHRCLLILDDVGVVLQNRELSEHYQNEYKCYRKLVRQIGESHHNSCLILNSREKLSKIASLVKEAQPVRVLQLSGLELEDAQKIFWSAKTFAATKKELAEIIKLYEANPLALKTVAKIIPDFLNNNLADFLQQNFLDIKNILNDFLEENFKLTELENKLMNALAVNLQPLSVEELQAKLNFSEDFPQLVVALEVINILGSLNQQGLIEKQMILGVNKYFLHSEVRKYINNVLIAKYLNKLGFKKYIDGEFKSAKFYLKWAISFNPNLAAAHYNLAATCEELKDLPNARIHYQVAAKYNNRAASAAINNLARLEIFRGHSTVAIDMILPKLDQVKDAEISSSLHKNLGWAYWLQQRYSEAKQHLRKAIELDSERAPAYCLLAKVQESLGDEQGALMSWENCLNKQPEKTIWKSPELDTWRIEARQRLNGESN
ncbi:NB-ARC domain-containing protein [Aerosakkonemataceae cyanobacterium BLCC-F50]|uniref:NB-ARC domain-containing protein n=1 Tax=Floridaenema flaviceps BLCC-F50 TaxID=3153642 RepID=A0ABV4XU41_9CYAN